MLKHWINEKTNRYYKIIRHPSFFGESIILMWGGINSKLGGYKIITYDTEEEIEKIIDKIAKRRKYREYILL
jgi:hypothetical protein